MQEIAGTARGLGATAMMNPELAKHIVDSLRGKEVGGWLVGAMRNSGGTAVVVESERDGKKVALKLYSKELVTRGKEKHLERLRRQLELRDHKQPHLVQILDAGECRSTGYLFVVMEFVEAPTLNEVVADVPRTGIRSIIRQVAQAAFYLHQRELVHRDIKPANIAVALPEVSAKLLDLGVVRPVLGDTITDDTSGSRFLGTRRYAPPEYFSGTEDHTQDGWTAITFYQLGGVLHDLIMRRRLFDGFEGEALPEAVRTVIPTIMADDVPGDLIQLAKDCLQKQPQVRHRIVTWDRFLREPGGLEAQIAVEGAMLRLQTRRAGGVPRSVPTGHPPPQETERALRSIEQAIDAALRSICIDSGAFPPLTMATPVVIPDKMRIVQRASFRYDVAERSPVFVHLTFATSLLDTVSRAIEVVMAVSLSRDRLDGPSADLPITIPCFAGTFDHGVLHTKLQEAVAVRVEWAISQYETMRQLPDGRELFLQPGNEGVAE